MKNFLRSLLALSLCLSLIHSAAIAAEDPRVDEILREHLDAMGGLGNWNRIESIQLNGTIERDGQTVDIVVVKKRPNQIRATVTLPLPGKAEDKVQLIRAHDGRTGWTATRLAGAPEMQKEELSAEAAAELLADAGVLPPLIKLWRTGAELEFTGTVSKGDEAVYRIHAIPEDLPIEYTFYVSADNFLVTHYESHHPVNGITTTQLDNYTETQSVLLPKRSIIKDTQTGTSVMNTSSAKIGVGIYEEYFEHNTQPSTAKL